MKTINEWHPRWNGMLTMFPYSVHSKSNFEHYIYKCKVSYMDSLKDACLEITRI